MQSLAFYLYVMAVGFVAAGLAASLAQLVSGRPLHFGMRNAWRGAREQARSPVWFGLSTVIAGVWSLLSG
ncbi:MAG: DUF6949 family protein [Methyloceanibacter sp.]|jgi:hypothetical protein